MAVWTAQKFYANNELKPMYFFYGNDTYLLEDAVLRVHYQVFGNYDLRPSENLSLEVFYGSSRPAQAISESTQSFGLFSQQKLILIKEAQMFREKDFQILTSVIDNPGDTNTLVFIADGSLPRSKFFKALAEKAQTVEFKTPYEREFPQWIGYLAKKNNITLAPQVSHILLQLLGTNLQLIDNELRKLALAKGPNAHIVEQDIQNTIASSKEESVFEFTNAFGAKNLNNSLRLLRRLLEQGQSAVSLVSLIARHLRILMEVSLHPTRDAQSLSADLGIPSFFMKEYLRQSQSWQREELGRVLTALRNCEKDLKSISLSPQLVIEEFLLSTIATRG